MSNLYNDSAVSAIQLLLDDRRPLQPEIHQRRGYGAEEHVEVGLD